MSYTLTVYCSDCNPPKHTGSRQTAIGAKATAGKTVSFHESMYKKYKGKQILLTIYDDDRETVLSKHMPVVQDFHRDGAKKIDLYIGERNKYECDCNNHEWSLKPCNFEIIK